MLLLQSGPVNVFFRLALIVGRLLAESVILGGKSTLPLKVQFADIGEIVDSHRDLVDQMKDQFTPNMVEVLMPGLRRNSRI